MLQIALFSFLAVSAFATAPDELPRLKFESQSYNRGYGIRKARPDEAESFFKVIERYIGASKQEGVKSKIGWFDLDVFLTEMRSLTIWFNQTSSAAVGSGTRVGGVYFTEEKAVLLNISLFHSLSNGPYASNVIAMGNEPWLLHEIMGALGYPDDHCQISCFYWANGFPKNYGSEVFSIWTGEVEKLLNANPRVTKNISVAKGTSTGFGGGGDPAAFGVKISALAVLGQMKQRALKQWHLSQRGYEELVRTIINLQIEPETIKDPYGDKPTFAAGPLVQVKLKDGKPYTIINAKEVMNTPIQETTRIGAALISELLRFERDKE